MRNLIKRLLALGAVAIIGVCFTLGIMQGMIDADQHRDAQRKERCDSMAWPRPAACAAVAQLEHELSPAAGGKK